MRALDLSSLNFDLSPEAKQLSLEIESTTGPAKTHAHITDAGLAHLAALKQLRRLMLPKAGLTKAAIAKLKRALPNCSIGSD